VAEKRLIEQTKPVDGKCANRVLSQWRGSPHDLVSILGPNLIDAASEGDLKAKLHGRLRYRRVRRELRAQLVFGA
jgi:hypothetical protein